MFHDDIFFCYLLAYVSNETLIGNMRDFASSARGIDLIVVFLFYIGELFLSCDVL